MAATLGNGNITFGDSTTQSTAALPLTGGTLSGGLTISGFTAQFPSHLYLVDTWHTTSKRALLQLGSGWHVLQDMNGNGTKDFLIYDTVNSAVRFYIGTTGKIGIGNIAPEGKLDVTGALKVSGNSDLPAGTGSSVFFAGGYASPDIGRIFIGDGTGWRLHFSKRASSTNTDLVTIRDNGAVGFSCNPPDNRNGVSLYETMNLGFQWSNTYSYANIFNQANSASLVLASGLQRSATANGFASSVPVSWGRSALVLSGEAIEFYGKAASTTAVGTDIAMTKTFGSNSTSAQFTIPLGANRLWTGYDSGETNSVNALNWFRSYSSTGWVNMSYGGGVYQTDSSTVRIYNDKHLATTGTVYANTFLDYYNNNYYLDLAAYMNIAGGIYANATYGNWVYKSQGDIGGAFADWNTDKTPALQVDCPSNIGAYMIWRATKWGERHLAAMECYAGGSSSGQVRVDLHVGGQGAFKYTFYENGYAYAAVAWVDSSDIRFKTNLARIENPLDKVKALNGYTYDRTDINTVGRQIGVVAQEVQAVVPELVTEDGQGYLAVSYGQMVALLIEAIKEQQTQIDELKARLPQ